MTESAPLPPITWCAIDIATEPGHERLTVTSLLGDAETDQIELQGSSGDEGALDRLARLLAGRLIITADARETARVLAAFDLDADDQLVDAQEWERVLWPGEPPPRQDSVVERGRRLLTRLCSIDSDVLRRSAVLALDGRDADRRLLTALAAELSPADLAGAELGFAETVPRPETLKRKRKAPRIQPSDVERLFGGPSGLATQLEHFERRDEQREMAVRVTQTLRDGGELLVEAGTGTGKSLAYLVPSLLHALQTGEQVTVATHTRALQDQLATRDAPVAIDLLQRTGAGAPDVSVLKGRGNYLCLRRWFQALRQPPSSEVEASFLAKVNLWVHRTESGDRAELPLRPMEGSRFSAISAEGEACDAQHCVFQQRNQCFLYRARRQADAAHLVITNHALLMTDLAQGGAALPLSRHLVIDEAHHLEQQATISFSRTLSGGGVNSALDEIEHTVRGATWGIVAELEMMLRLWTRLGLDPGEAERCSVAIQVAHNAVQAARLHVGSLFGLLHGVVEERGERGSEYSRTVRLTAAIRNAPAWLAIEQAWDTLSGQLLRVHEALDELHAFARRFADFERERDESDEADDQNESDLEIRISTARATLVDIGLLGSEAVLNPEADAVYWIESGRDASRASLHSAPLDLATFLQEQLYSRHDSVVLTSATLTSGDSFSYVRQRLGLPDADELALASPFDYERAAMLCTVSDVPEPSAAGYSDAVHEAVINAAMASNGRTLVLFTSLAAMNAARRAVSEPLAAAGLSVVTQHEDGNAEQLAERLRSFERTVVLGAAAFWEGIDVPGPALSSLVIVRLPFSVPTDPIIAARSERFDNPFIDYSLPEAILRFRQGFGRLIRRRTDRGVCVVLDRRILSKRYGTMFVRALPPCAKMTVTSGELGQAVSDWLHST